jgi:iron-sulfur cluster assembly protein
VAVVLTENALKRARAFIGSPGPAAAGVGLRIGIRRTGCSGMAYVVSVAESVTPADVVFEQAGVQVVIDREALAVIDGTEVDFVREGLNEAFRSATPTPRASVAAARVFPSDNNLRVLEHP